MAVRVETRIGQGFDSERIPKQEFEFGVIRIDQAWVACFMPECKTPIKYGWSDFDIKEGKGKGRIVKSVFLDDGVSYRPNSTNGYSHFSAQPRLVADVKGEKLGKELIEMFEDIGSRAQIDCRYKDRVRIYIGSCDVHSRGLKRLKVDIINGGYRINRAILEGVISFLTPK